MGDISEEHEMSLFVDACEFCGELVIDCICGGEDYEDEE